MPRFDAALEQAKIESLAQFAAGAGHEINNPIAVISGRAQLLLDGETDAERRNSLALIHAQAVRVHEMIADLRLFARPPKPEFNPLDLTALVDRVIREMTDRAASQGTQLSAGPAQTVHIAADEVQLAVALKALVANSLEALREGGRVEIAIEAADGEVRIRVGDSGPGIAEEERRHIFDPYFAGRQAGRGLGMGLCKCWQIVRQHGGRIDVESPPGQGAAFTIVLPDRRTETESCDATQEPSPQ